LLTIHILNVNQGDSILIQYAGPSGTAFGLIDSNTTGQEDPPALSMLNNLGATELSFIALTHPHADHYRGLSRIIERYRQQISHFYSFPLGHLSSERIKKIGEIYQELYNSVESCSKVKTDTLEFVKILSFVKRYIGLRNWEEPNGFYNLLAPVGFNGVAIAVLLPSRKVKGRYFEMIEKGSRDILSNQNPNNLSLAFSFKYKEHEIILGGDALLTDWIAHKKFCSNGSYSLNGNVVKLPHHGAREDCSSEVIDHLFHTQAGGVACISANGQTHPHSKTLKTIREKNIKPYCTNLSKECGNLIQDLHTSPETPPDLLRFINSVAIKKSARCIQACQGDITISIEDNGELNIQTEYQHACPYRGDYDFLSG